VFLFLSLTRRATCFTKVSSLFSLLTSAYTHCTILIILFTTVVATFAAAGKVVAMPMEFK
jgi:hypothetical protein